MRANPPSAFGAQPSALQGRRRLLLGFLGIGGGLAMARLVRAADEAEITWDDLVPPDWDPMDSFKDQENLGMLPDSDARVQKLYRRLREVWDNAPTVPSLAGRAVRLPGYVVPLETGKAGLREFLLVPYFGACIHTPPPPANQIVHVRSASPVKGIRSMDAVWVRGTLGLERSGSAMGVAGYTMSASRVEKYEAEPNGR